MQDLWSKYIQIRQLTNVTVCTIPLRKGCVPPIIKRQCCPHIETSQLICIGNQLTGFCMRATLAVFFLLPCKISENFVQVPERNFMGFLFHKGSLIFCLRKIFQKNLTFLTL